MNDTKTKTQHVETTEHTTPDWAVRPAVLDTVLPHEPGKQRKASWLLHKLPVVITLSTVAVAVAFTWSLWGVYMAAPWTRDATARAYIVTMAPEVAGRVVELPVSDNQFVHKGDVLMVIDPTDYRIAVELAQAQVVQTAVTADNARAQSARRDKLDYLAVSEEAKQTFRSNWLSADASHQQALANLEQAKVKLERTRIVSPANGYVTNLLTRLGDYANVGENLISVIDADSFWVDGYFEETNLSEIHEGDFASIELMGYSQIVRGHVDSISRGINVTNAQPNQQGVATVNPIFTWVRLAQRIPVRIHIDEVPAGVVLAAGMTATVHIAPR
jgi:RND family efflux transporter MFP subunit